MQKFFFDIGDVILKLRKRSNNIILVTSVSIVEDILSIVYKQVVKVRRLKELTLIILYKKDPLSSVGN